MTPDQFNADEALAAEKAEFDKDAKALREAEVPLMAQLVADDIPGAKVEIVDTFDPEGEVWPRVAVVGPPKLLYTSERSEGVVERWTQASVTVRSWRGRFELSRFENNWSQKPGGEPDWATSSGSAIGEIIFDPKNGIDLLKNGLESGALFRRR